MPLLIAHPDAAHLAVEAFLGSNDSQLLLNTHDFVNRPAQDNLYLFAKTPEGAVAIHIRDDEEARVIRAEATAAGWKILLFLTVPSRIHAQSKVTNITFGPANPDPP